MRMAKRRFCLSALHLPYAYGFCRKGEAAAFYNMRALINAAARKTPNAEKAYHIGTPFSLGFSSKSRNFVLSA